MATDTELMIRIKADVDEAKRNIEGMRSELRGTGRAGEKAGRGGRRAAQGTRRAGQAAKQARSQFAKLKVVLAGAFALHELTRFTRAMVDANTQAQALGDTFAQVFGADGAAAQMQYVKALADDLGKSIVDLGMQYGQFAATAKEAGIQTESIQDLFRGTAEAASVLNVPTARLNTLFRRMAPDIAQNVFRMTDLRVITKNLPGSMDALRQAADRVGVSLEDVMDGEVVPAIPLLREFGNTLHEQFGERAALAAQGLDNQIQRLHNTFFEMATDGTGFADDFADAIGQLNDALNDPAVQQGLSDLISGLGQLVTWTVKAAAKLAGLGTAIGEFAGRLVAGPDTAIGQLNEQIETTVHQIENLQNKINQPARLRIGVDADELDQLLQERQQRLAQLIATRDHIKAARANVPDTQSPADDNTPRLQMEGSQGLVDVPDADSATTTVDTRAQAIQRLIDALKQQAATYGATNAEIKLYKLQTLGASDAQVEAARTLLDSIAAQKQAAEVEKQRNALQAKRAEQTRDILDKLDPSRIQARQTAAARKTAEALVQVHKLTRQQADAYVALVEQGGKNLDELNQFAVQAARNMQDAFAQGFFDIMNGNFDDMLRSFVRVLQQMAAQALAANLADKLFGEDFTSGKSTDMGGWVGAAASIAASFFHDGGTVGAGTPPMRRVPAPLFANAPRFHDGLAPDEFPAILQTGEQVIPRGEAGANAAAAQDIKIVNTIDAGSFVSEGLGTAPGQKAVMNFVRANRASIKQVLA